MKSKLYSIIIIKKWGEIMQTMLERYKNAEKLCPWNAKDAVLNAEPEVKELDENHFYYGLDQRIGEQVVTEFRKVNTLDGSEEALFDTEKLCQLMEVEVLPFHHCEVKEGILSFSYEDMDYFYDLKEETLRKEESRKEEGISVSPDESFELFVKEYNLYLRDKKTKEEIQLSFDGEKDFAYGKVAEYSGYITEKVRGVTEKPDVLWSKDSKKFLTYKSDQRKVKELYIIQSYDEEGRESIRPRLHTYKCAFPEDENVPACFYYIGDVEKKTLTEVHMEPQISGGRMFGRYFSRARWMKDDQGLYTTLIRRGNKSADFVYIDLEGNAKHLVSEKSDTFLNISTYGNLDGYNDYCASNFLTDDRQYVIWQSERDEFARLFRYDAESRERINAVTPADVSVGEIISHDDEYIYYYASNLKESSDPYYQYVCRSRYDGSGFEVLTKEDGMHRCQLAAGVIVDTCSRVDLPPVTNIYRKDGSFVRELVKSDICDLLARGYVIPERFTVTASDGETVLYGIIVKPRDFDERKTYPMIDYIYGGMQCYNVPKAFAYRGAIQGREMLGGLEAFAQLGFVGIILDGLGTPGRGKKLHEISYENIHGCAGLKDHVYCLKELKEKFPFIDLDRLGIWGNSGGGCATSRAMLEYPEVYKVGVSSAGNHDQRMYNNQWTENYYGLYNKEIYLKGDNTSLAKNLKGKLFIVHGAMDDNVAMSQSIRMIDALIEEDKDFDFLILPRVNHNVPADPYFIRKKLDYFTKYLLKEEVPEYRFVLEK